MKLKNSEQFYTGVYGICIQDGKVLLIKKARGPYKGTYDLPGGGIEFGESIEDTLKREFIEETDSTVDSFEFINYNQQFSKYKNSAGEDREMHHLGMYFTVNISFDKIKEGADGEDSLGAEFIDVSELSNINISPIAKPMIDEILKKI